MERGLFIAASGMLAAQVRQDVIANNLANATNPGFKGEVLVQQVAFGDLLLSNTHDRREGRPAQRRHAVVTDISRTSPTRGSAGRRTRSTSRSAGTAGSPCRRRSGVRYTRNGAFTTDAQGFLTTAQGDRVLGKSTASRSLSGGDRVSIARNGDVHVGEPPRRHRRGRRARPVLAPQAGRRLPDGHDRRRTRKVGLGRAGRARDVERQLRQGDGRADREHARVRGRPEGVHAIDDTLDKAVNQVGRV